jgi:hypothetical protein
MVFKYIRPFPRIFTICLFVISSLAVIAEENPEKTQLRLNFPFAELSASEVDLGIIARGSHAQGSVTIQNTGVHPLMIATVRSSCGIMASSWPRQPVEPGAKVSISFRYDARAVGPFERIITIHTNAWQKDLRLKVKGQVVEPGEDMPE